MSSPPQTEPFHMRDAIETQTVERVSMLLHPELTSSFFEMERPPLHQLMEVSFIKNIQKVL
jgi:hypothetical protein